MDRELPKTLIECCKHVFSLFLLVSGGLIVF